MTTLIPNDTGLAPIHPTRDRTQGIWVRVYDSALSHSAGHFQNLFQRRIYLTLFVPFSFFLSLDWELILRIKSWLAMKMQFLKIEILNLEVG